MKLWAFSDLHLAYEENRRALDALPSYGGDWVIVAGDVGELEIHLSFALERLTQRFARVFWVPGNHELWSLPGRDGGLRGVERYERLVDLCRAHGAVTPEDPFVRWPGAGPETYIAPVFVGYDYSFAPDGMAPADAVAWAREHLIVCRDESVLHPDPYPSREAWCAARVALTEARLGAVPRGAKTVLVAHWPLRRDLVRLFRIPRFAPWCGTRATEDWHLRYDARVVVSGHLHMRATDWRDGVRFEEVSIGYPKHWTVERGMAAYLREILPGPPEGRRDDGPIWHR